MSKKSSNKKTKIETSAASVEAAHEDEILSESGPEVNRLASQAAEALAGLMGDTEVAQETQETEETPAADELPQAEPDFELSGIDFNPEEEDHREVVLDEGSTSVADPEADSVEGTELESFSSAAIEVEETLSEDRIASIVESLLFSTDRPQSVAVIKAAFKGTNVRSHHIRRALDQLQIDYADVRRGVYLEEVAGGYQLRTKTDNMDYLRRTVKAKPFRVSGPALETLAIIAYKQPCTKHQVDEIRGVESGHLMRALMEKNLVHFEGKSELPGKPMLYGTTRRFLEIFGLRNLQELPSLHEIDQLIPEGIGDVEEKETLDSLTGVLSKEVGITYSEGEEELLQISEQLEKVSTTTDFFEEEKRRQRAARDAERAQDIRDGLAVGEEVSEADRRWLERYDRSLAPSESVAPPANNEEPSALS